MNPRPSLFQLLVGTCLHKIPYGESGKCLALIEGQGLPLTYEQLSAHHLAGGRMTSWIEGLIYARERGLKISPTNAAARDLVEAYGAKRSLRVHLQEFEARGVRDLDAAPVNVALLAGPNLPPPSA